MVAEGYTLSGYRALLEAALSAGYAFARFDEAERAAEPVCLLRHDVDVDPGAALELAQLEAALGVRATYFFMLRSPVYNLFGRGNSGLVSEILSLGHHLGLHYDVAFSPIERSHADAIEVEAHVLTAMFSAPVQAVSFHQPGSVPDVGSIEPRGLVSAYDLAGFDYLSDANRTLDPAELCSLLRTARYPRVQLLVHPIWWASGAPGTTEDAWDRALLSNLERTQAQILATERAYGPPRSFTIGRSET